MPKTALPFVACLLAIAAIGADAQSIWKWRDSSGQMHIGDTPPPPGTPAKDIAQRPGGAALAIAPPANPASAPATDLQNRKLQADADKADRQKADKAAVDQKNAAARADNCRAAQQSAAVLQSGQRVAQLSPSGEREYLDDTARAAQLKHAQDMMAQSCGAPAAN